MTAVNYLSMKKGYKTCPFIRGIKAQLKFEMWFRECLTRSITFSPALLFKHIGSPFEMAQGNIFP